ncbi:MAG: hypothetical protein WKF36_02125 [Candidatus Nitrosocosmicus sp.]
MTSNNKVINPKLNMNENSNSLVWMAITILFYNTDIPNPQTADKKHWPLFVFGRREYPIILQHHGEAIVLRLGFCEGRIIIVRILP